MARMEVVWSEENGMVLESIEIDAVYMHQPFLTKTFWCVCLRNYVSGC